MSPLESTTFRAVAKFALVAAASAAAASLWAQGRPEMGLLLDAQTWRQEVVTAQTGPWPENDWYRLTPLDKSVEVRSVKPSEGMDTVAADALYVRLPGTALRQGRLAGYRYPERLQQPRMGVDHELMLGRERFSLRADYVEQGVEYTIGWGGEAHRYVLGAPGADHTVVRAIADMDGDRQPDFVIDVDDGVYLLLSTQARPGANVPTAHYTEQGS